MKLNMLLLERDKSECAAVCKKETNVIIVKMSARAHWINLSLDLCDIAPVGVNFPVLVTEIFGNS